MFYKNQQFQKKIYNFVDGIEKFDQKMKILPVDFQKPWWDIIAKQKVSISLVTVTSFLTNSFDSLFPLIIAYTINLQSIFWFLIAVGVRFAFTLIYNTMLRYNTVFQIQTMASVEYVANQYFLTVDPVFHSTKSSGQIVAKVGRGSSSYESFLDIMTFELLGIVASLTTVIVAMFAFGLELGFIASSFIVLITIFNISAHFIRSKIFEPLKIMAEDKLKSINLENLQQAPFIRASFATIGQLFKSENALKIVMVKEGNSWQSGMYVNLISRILYISSFLCLGLAVFWQLEQGIINPVLAIAILTTYSNGTGSVLFVGNKIKRLTKSLAAITDLYDFIRDFGKQTYPVLDCEIETN